MRQAQRALRDPQVPLDLPDPPVLQVQPVQRALRAPPVPLVLPDLPVLRVRLAQRALRDPPVPLVLPDLPARPVQPVQRALRDPPVPLVLPDLPARQVQPAQRELRDPPVPPVPSYMRNTGPLPENPAPIHSFLVSHFKITDKGRDLRNHIVHILKHGALGSTHPAGGFNMCDDLLILLLDPIKKLA